MLWHVDDPKSPLTVEKMARIIVDELLQLRAFKRESAVDSDKPEFSCDPHTCKELQEAIGELLQVQEALGGYAASAAKPGELALVVRELVANLVTLRDAVPAPGDSYLVPAGYEGLFNVFVHAVDQAANGKGKARHATDEPFERQPSVLIAGLLSMDYPLGQAMKKIHESKRLADRAALNELLGALVYTAIPCMLIMERLWERAGQPEPVHAAPAVSFAEGSGHD